MQKILSKKITFLSLLTSLLFLSPALLFGQGKPLSQPAQSIKRNITATYEAVLDQRSTLAQTPGLQKQNNIESIKEYNRKKEEIAFPSNKTLFIQFYSQIENLSNSDEKLLLTIFLERTIITLAPVLYTEADYNTVKRHLNDLKNLSKSSLKECSQLYSLLGDTYSFIMQYEGVASFIRNGPKAQKAYKKAYTLDNQNYIALSGLAAGDLFSPKIAGGNINRAMKNFSFIASSTPLRSERYFSLFFLGIAFEKTKERDKAIETWKKADLIFPDLLAGKLLRVIEIGGDPGSFMEKD